MPPDSLGTDPKGRRGGGVWEHVLSTHEEYLRAIARRLRKVLCGVSLSTERDDNLGLLFPGKVIGWRCLNMCKGYLLSLSAGAAVQLRSSLTVALRFPSTMSIAAKTV